MHKSFGSAFFIFSVTFLSIPFPALAEEIDLSIPVCPAPFKINGAKCADDPDARKKLTTADACSMAGVEFKDNACQIKGAPPAAECRQVAAGTLVLKGDKCLFDSHTTSSASGDYVGDYFIIMAVPADDTGKLGGPVGTKLKVLSQKPLGENDKLLKVAPIKNNEEKILIGNVDLSGTTKDVKASDYIDYGARRIGWTYGALAIPYKYYPGSKNLGGGVAIGPYVGRRWGQPGSAFTLAASAALGSVKGEVRDANDKVVSTPDLMAYSVALGGMWDISKAQGVKPFKIGVFVGVDTVSSDDVVKFKNNRKPWLAFQIGFDFTDN